MGRPDWTTKAPANVVRTASDKLAAGHSAESVFRELDLGRFCVRSSFREWARRKRNVQQQHGERNRLEAHTTDAQERARTALLNALDGLNTALAAGSLKPNQLIGSLIGIARVLQLEEVDKPKVEREEEKHAAWVEERRNKQAAALDENAGPAGLTPEQLAVIKSKVLGI